MKNKKNLFYNFTNKMFVVLGVLFFCSAQNSVLAVDVDNWTDLQTQVQNYTTPINITVTKDIVNAGESTITNSKSGTSIDASHSPSNYNISGNNATQIFNNTGGLSILNTIIKNGKSQFGGAIMNYGTLNAVGATFSNNVASDPLGTLYGGLLTGSGKPLPGSNPSDPMGEITKSGLLGVGGFSLLDYVPSDSGGAIYSNGGELNISSSLFSNNRTRNTTSSVGGAIRAYNFGIQDTITGSTFDGNSSRWGGAIGNFNCDGISTIDNSTFTNNYASTQGGAVYSYGYGGTILTEIKNSTFTGNSSGLAGGAILNKAGLNESSSTIDLTIDNSIFTGNHATTNMGGAIFAFSGTAVIKNSTFNGNYSIDGGAICNYKDVNNPSGTLIISDSSFNNNSSTIYDGGAIDNYATTTLTNTPFTSNTAAGSGGAIYNSGTLTANNATFSGNTATDGGAIYNTGTATFTNTTFTGNNATANGGAIYNNGTLYLKADGGQVILSGNTAGAIHNGLYNHGTVYLNAGNGGSITFNDTVNSSDITTSTININSPAVSSTLTDGTINFNNNVTNSTINLYGGQIHLGVDSALTGGSLNIFGCALSMINNAVGASALQTLTLADGTVTHMGIDVDLANKISDRIIVTAAAYGNGTISVDDIHPISYSNLSSLSTPFADAAFRDRVLVSVKTLSTPLYLYNVGYSATSGDLTFTTNGFSPNSISSAAAQTSTFLLQTSIDKQLFGNVEGFMSFPLSARESTICCELAKNPNSPTTGSACPISGNGVFSPIYSCDLNRGIWVRDFVSFENIPLINGPNVSTIEYGTLIGADAPLRRLGHGFVGNTSAFVGYLGSNQNYDNIGVSQNGALVGLAENMVKKNFFLTLMASVGSSLGNANTPYGTDNFSSLFAGLAGKGGYNFEFKDGEYIIQPNLVLAYTFINTPDYQAASGLNMSSKPLNAMQIAPGVRLIKNMRHEKGQVYLLANWVYNVMDNVRFTANDVQLPQLSIAPYIEYGIGFQRVWKERFTGFFPNSIKRRWKKRGCITIRTKMGHIIIPTCNQSRTLI